jgi:hypothetical protein
MLCADFNAQASGAPTEEAQVYRSLFGLMQFPKPNARVFVVAETQDTGCGEEESGRINLNGCGIWTPPATESSIHEVLLKSWPALLNSTWTSFTSLNKTSIELSSSLQLPPNFSVKSLHQQYSLAGSPDGVIVVSRVGFSDNKKQAMVYSLFMSYMQVVPTSANLFLFRRESNGEWKPEERLTLLQMGG